MTADGREATDSVELFKLLNKIGHDHGVGRVDVSPGPTISLQEDVAYSIVDRREPYVHLRTSFGLAIVKKNN